MIAAISFRSASEKLAATVGGVSGEIDVVSIAYSVGVAFEVASVGVSTYFLPFHAYLSMHTAVLPDSLLSMSSYLMTPSID